MTRIAISTVTVVTAALGFSCHAMVLLPSNTRRVFLEQSGFASSYLISSCNAMAPENPSNNNLEDSASFHTIKSQLDATTIPWDYNSTSRTKVVDWKNLRYGSSTLLDKSRAPLSSTQTPTKYPAYMTGTFLIRYRFLKSSFPQTRDKMSIRVAGAGLGTCLSLPNVGYNPFPFVGRYLPSLETGRSSSSSHAYEDAVYNVPRRFEAFWPESKVTAVQVGSRSSSERGGEVGGKSNLTPKCFVTGEGCSTVDNPSLRSPSTRIVMEFLGPTRSRGYLSQSIDVTMLAEESSSSGAGPTEKEEFIVCRQYAQLHVNQDLQTFYKEIVMLAPSKTKEEEVNGRVRVAAFLPNIDSGTMMTYDDASALAIYDYKISLKKITDEEALQI